MGALNNLWESVQPLVLLLMAGVVSSAVIAVIYEVKNSAWYKRQPWVVRKAIDALAYAATRQLQPQADKLKEIYGTLPKQDAKALQAQAVDAVINKALDVDPVTSAAIFKIPNVEKVIAGRVDQAVEIVKKQEAKKRKRAVHRGK
jgi:hypothetical protein